MMFVAIVYSDLATHMSNTQVLAILVAALCHDVEHPGVTSTFEINTLSMLSTRYNDKSVLENHHAAVTFEILFNTPGTFWEQLSDDQKKQARGIIIETILQTDMSLHFESTSRISSAAVSTNRDPSALDQPEHLMLLMTSTMHTCDLSNDTKSWSAARVWTSRIQEEFQKQVEREKQLGIPVSTYLESADLEAQIENQVKFLDFIVIPWWDCYTQLVPALEPFLDVIRSQREHWNHAASLDWETDKLEWLKSPPMDEEKLLTYCRQMPAIGLKHTTPAHK